MQVFQRALSVYVICLVLKSINEGMKDKMKDKMKE